MHISQNYNAFGSEVSPTTLTASFVAGSTIFAKGFKKVAFDIKYAPVTTNAYAQILFEYSNEDKNTASPVYWKPLSVEISSTVEADVYAAGGTNMGTASGTPINVPAPNTSTGAVTYTAHVTPDTDLVANFIRVKVLENQAAASFGTISVVASLQS